MGDWLSYWVWTAIPGVTWNSSMGEGLSLAVALENGELQTSNIHGMSSRHPCV